MISATFKKIYIQVIDDIVRSLPDISCHVDFLKRLGSTHCDVEIESRLLELMGPVFCNTVRPLLLVQGKWSYKVGGSWILTYLCLGCSPHGQYRSPI